MNKKENAERESEKGRSMEKGETIRVEAETVEKEERAF